MKIIHRYLLLEFVPPFFYAFGLITMIILLNLIVQTLGKIAGKGLDPFIIAEFFFLNLAWIVALAVPMAVLMATLMAFGRLSADNEVTALRAAGVGLWQLIGPYLAVGVLLCWGLIEFNNRVLPEFNHRARVLMSDIHRKRPTLTLQEGMFIFDLPHYVLWARRIDQEASRLYDLVIYDESNSRYPTMVSAEQGDLSFVAEDETFHLELTQGEIHREDARDPDFYQRTRFDRSLLRLSAPNMVFEHQESGYRSDREMSAPQMWQQVQEMKKEPDKNRRRINAFLVEIHKKYSIPMACIVFVLIGAPLGVRAHRGGIGVAASLSVLFFLVYWAFLIGGEDLADRGLVTPAMAMWSPNLLLGAIGFFLILRTTREIRFLDRLPLFQRRNRPK
ncbi:MAG: YjgP/YjgQ family permease [Candidatus Zixiibacteriota bacterium]|nr:MAG: YjgP/YjgQ family permease [candidate division Zixibacteria bacterium]